MIEPGKVRQRIAGTGWLSLTPPAFQRSVLERAMPRQLKAGETLHFTGDDSTGMYGVLTGRLRVTISGDEHGPYLVHMLRPGSWIGEGPSITGRASVVTPTAAVTSELLFLPLAAINEIVRRDPAHWRFFIIPLQDHFELSVGAVADLVQRDYVKRIAASLLRLGGCRTGAASRRSKIEIDASQEEIAIMANVARTTAGSVLRDLARKGVIEVGYGRITLLAPARLRAILAD